MADVILGSEQRPLRVAIVGSGPSAFYAAEALLTAPGLAACVDVFDRLPTPYGLVRGGVAPDHQKIKSVIRVYQEIAARPGFRFFGNVMLGRDLQVEDLRQCYDQVVYAVGNESDRAIGIPGEELGGVHSATAFVGWYNGHPDYCHLTFDLANARQAIVVGNGNVAMDVTRILAKDPAALADTDIADYALAALRGSQVREVALLGRRGPAQAAFSPKEIEEIGSLAGCDLVVTPADAELDALSLRWLEAGAPRSAQRNVKYLREQSAKPAGSAPRRVRCRFLVSPVAFLGEAGRVTAVRMQRNELVEGRDGEPRARGLEQFEIEPAQLVFKAIGYRGVPIAGVPFDDREGIIPNHEGRVLDAKTRQHRPGEYVVGWAKRGPTGLIGTNSPDAKATVAKMLEDSRGLSGAASAGAEAIPQLLRQRGVDWVSYDDWQRLDRYEVEQGVTKGKVRDKLTRTSEMLAVIRQLRSR